MCDLTGKNIGKNPSKECSGVMGRGWKRPLDWQDNDHNISELLGIYVFQSNKFIDRFETILIILI